MAHQFQPQFGVFRAVVRAICVEQGKYEDARRTYSDALAIAESFGGADSRLAKTLNNLGASCFDGGRYAEAEIYYLRAVEMWKPENPFSN